MDLALLVYAISTLGSLHNVLGVLLFISTLASIGFCIGVLSNVIEPAEYSWNLDKEGNLKPGIVQSRKTIARCAKWSVAVALTTSSLLVLLPSERTAYLMVGAYATQKIAEDPKVQETGNKVLQVINQKLDEVLEQGKRPRAFRPTIRATAARSGTTSLLLCCAIKNF